MAFSRWIARRHDRLHILKPDHVDSTHYPHSVANEWFCMTLAAAVGLAVPMVRLLRVPEPVFLISRFDRQIAADGSARRLPVLDACQLLSLDRTWKYRESTLQTLVKLIACCREKAATRLKLYRWQVFNLLQGNGDAHLKKLSFATTATGIRLAPHYDLLSTAVYRLPDDWSVAELSCPLGAVRRFSEVRRSQVIAAGATLGLPTVLAARVLDEMRNRLRAAHTQWQQRLEEPSDEPRFLPGELRLLRQIRFAVFARMDRQTA